MTNIDEILEARKETHGEYRDHAQYAQLLKEVINIAAAYHRPERKQMKLSHIQLESLDMIAHKIGRILAGNPNEPDHWDDIAGYAKLVADRLREDRLGRPFMSAEELKDA
jgi:hypothetical protein